MTVEDALPWLREHRDEFLEQIRSRKYKPQPIRRKEIPKLDGGVRQLGILTIIDRVIQQVIAQQLTTIFEPKFIDGSFTSHPNKSAAGDTEGKGESGKGLYHSGGDTTSPSVRF